MGLVPRPVPNPIGPGQESVWDYPRPPRLERTSARLEVVLGGTLIASTTQGWRVLETSHPPNYYLPRGAFVAGSIEPATGSSYCEWKGVATYWTLRHGDHVAPRAAWSYEAPDPAFALIRGHLALYPALVDECRVDGEVVRAQPGGFYGGWITDAIAGPFKGDPGTQGW
jgi:uncharacterized protein (DUF427 family)